MTPVGQGGLSLASNKNYKEKITTRFVDNYYKKE